MNKLFYTPRKLALLLALSTVPAFSGTLYFTNSYNYVDDTSGFTPYAQYNGNGTSASAGGAIDGVTVSSSSNLTSGVMQILNEGAVGGNMNAASEATMGDTITALGSTGGLNLGVNINVGGVVNDTNISNNNTFFVVDILPVGTFDQSNYFTNILASQIYSLGPDSDPQFGWQSYGTALTGNIPSGTGTIPLSFSFASIGTSFQVFVSIQSYEIGSAGVWTTDYTDPFSVSLSAPNGVTLLSDGGIAGTTIEAASTPEPATALLLLTGLAVFAAKKRFNR